MLRATYARFGLILVLLAVGCSNPQTSGTSRQDAGIESDRLTKADLDAFQGEWKLVSVERDGEALEELPTDSDTFKGSDMIPGRW
jgi:hypothetical protein